MRLSVPGVRNSLVKKHSQKTEIDPANWVDEHGDVLYRFALLRVEDPHVAEDLVQEAFISALQGLDSFKGRSAIRTWLVGILKHKIIDYFRKSTREIASSDLSGSGQDPDEDAINRLADAHAHPRKWIETPDNLMENKEFWKVFTARWTVTAPRKSVRYSISLRRISGLYCTGRAAS
jgi:RNA polymerase sigma-70 factor (ECF subfamily)